jgi:thiol-disulfide isomerase/thioredoxin
MRKVISSLALIFTIVIPLTTPANAAFPDKSQAFDFTLLDGSVSNLSEYQEKPIVLDWSASWCSFCKANQVMFSNVYEAISPHANLITISYGLSGDNLDKVKQIQQRGDYPWIFGLDHTEYSKDADTQNADIWIMDKDLNILYSWDHVILDQSDFLKKLSDVVGVEIKVGEEVQTFGLFENPLFLGFVGISIIAVIVVFISKAQNVT